MAFRASMRRDQRRRLLASRQRDNAGGDEAASGGAGPGAVTAYDDEAHPERHPAIATRLPVSAGRFVAVTLGILLACGGSIAVAVSGPLFGRPLLAGSGRFARTLAVLASAFDPQVGLSVQVWLAELAILAAAVVAGSVRFMRRHRRDDYKGRFRAWGWLAWLLAAAAWAGAVPLGPLVSSFVSDATGIVLGPNGVGWWVAAAAVAFAIVLPWAVLPLRERGATLAWMVLAMAAWSVAAAMPWATAAGWFGGEARGLVVAQAAWVAGAGLVLVAMLAAARSVIREVRGQCAAPPARRPKRKPAAAAQAAEAADERGDDAGESAAELDGADEDQPFDEAAEMDDDRGDGDFVDGSEGGHRRLSKAERKRLRKLARMNGHAA